MSGAEEAITPAMLPSDVRHNTDNVAMPSMQIPDEGINFVAVVSQLERDLILRCLEKTGGNKRQAARLLQLSRTTLIDKLQARGKRRHARTPYLSASSSRSPGFAATRRQPRHPTAAGFARCI
jgi:DNA-binding NtrC family response regulator